MDKVSEIKIRLDERLKVYKDSPQVTATYIDLAHMVEDLLFVIELNERKDIGFKG